ncbi:MAG: hypothetical protein IPK54_10245 [Dokdonella sp.]|uniref:hypothetical protein n=1 Tax=Dokdonella sp. TaxID=2291710 RepID=UPI0025B826F1|nr:hypothetical protein [Dokdonella sp.]MBK8123912.1 hypothetical protein [Dokdonella sp.]
MFAVVGRKAGKYYLFETSMNRGHEPSWTIAEILPSANKWRPKKTLIETVSYQKTLEWLLLTSDETSREEQLLEGFDDKRQKYHRIVDGISGLVATVSFYSS